MLLLLNKLNYVTLSGPSHAETAGLTDEEFIDDNEGAVLLGSLAAVNILLLGAISVTVMVHIHRNKTRRRQYLAHLDKLCTGTDTSSTSQLVRGVLS